VSRSKPPSARDGPTVRGIGVADHLGAGSGSRRCHREGGAAGVESIPNLRI